MRHTLLVYTRVLIVYDYEQEQCTAPEEQGS